MKNSHKHTALIRLACIALVAFDCWLVSVFPTGETALAIALPLSGALATAIAPVYSRFTL
jgi:hypothetical protein